MAYESSQGIVFTFNNVVYTATAISISKSSGEFNVTSLNIPAGQGCFSRYRAGGLKSVEAKVDWVGSTLPPTDSPYDLVFGGSGPGSGTALTGGEAVGKAIATGLTITAQAGDLLRGSATFKLTVD